MREPRYVRRIDELMLEEQALIVFDKMEDEYIECDEEGNCHPIYTARTFSQWEVDNMENVIVVLEEE